MSDWPSSKSAKVFRALLRVGWRVKHRRGSHTILVRVGWEDFVWAFHDNEELGPKILARISKKTGLKPKDL